MPKAIPPKAPTGKAPPVAPPAPPAPATSSTPAPSATPAAPTAPKAAGPKASQAYMESLGLSAAEASEVIGGEGIELGDELLAGMDDFVAPVNGPEMIGLAAAGDNGPQHKVRVILTSAMWINIRDGDYNIALAGKQAMMIALATLGALESASALVADGDAGLLLILGIMVAVQFKMFFTVATTALEAEAQVSVVSGAVLKDYIKKGIEYAQTALANNSLADMQALAAKYREFKGKAFGLLMSTKVSFYLTNHHTTSTSTWESYSRKYVDAVFLHGPQQVGGIAECCMDGGPFLHHSRLPSLGIQPVGRVPRDGQALRRLYIVRVCL